MPNVLVREVPQVTLDALKQRARSNHRSLQQEILTILQASAGESPVRKASEVATAIRARLAEGGRQFGDSVALVREDRER